MFGKTLLALALAMTSLAASGVTEKLEVCAVSTLDDGSQGYMDIRVERDSRWLVGDSLATGDKVFKVFGVVNCCWGGVHRQRPTGPYPVVGVGVIPANAPDVMIMSHHRVIAIGSYGQPEAVVNHQVWRIPWPPVVGSVATWDEIGVFAMPYGRYPADGMVDVKVPAEIVDCKTLRAEKWRR